MCQLVKPLWLTAILPLPLTRRVPDWRMSHRCLFVLAMPRHIVRQVAHERRYFPVRGSIPLYQPLPSNIEAIHVGFNMFRVVMAHIRNACYHQLSLLCRGLRLQPVPNDLVAHPDYENVLAMH